MTQLLNDKKIKKIDLITNSEIIKSIENNEIFKKTLINNEKVRIIIIAESSLKIFLTSSENFMSLTLFFKDGHYDDSQILIGKTKDSIKWAEELHSIYEKK